MMHATKIVFHRAEGQSHECIPQTFTGPAAWEMAELHVMVAARTAPRDGGYDKCDVEITFEGDGREPEVYRTRYDMVHPESGNYTPLARHVLSAWNFYSGRRLPAHFTPERWQQLITNLNIEPEKRAAMLDRCYIPTPGSVTL